MSRIRSREVTTTTVLLRIGPYGIMCVYLISPLFIFSMAVTRQFESGSRLESGAGGQDRLASTEDRVRQII